MITRKPFSSLIYLASIKPNDKEKCFLQIARYNFYFKT
ncbi:hypothetical protein LD85_0646 [Saccharolobus islandicus L.D.8.5]|uniref:Uncharacterized protein n=1 Tax=Saccharolobus islandicus (strain L.D.8.5 / Lassen \|nr:hypothetical protein LD85_0646 [Sulfolobus islandicus L.D.8.5]